MTIFSIGDYRDIALEIPSFAVGRGESWCLVGDNDAGLDHLIELIASASQSRPQVRITGRIEVLSFAEQQEIFEEELRKDETDYLDCIDYGTPAREFIQHPEKHGRLIERFGFRHCLDKGFRQLSSGESRKLLLIASLSRNPDLLVLENPYDGLDHASCLELDHTLQELAGGIQAVLVTVNNLGDIPSWCDHLGLLHAGKLVLHGKRDATLPQLAGLIENKGGFQISLRSHERRHAGEELVRLTDGFARYGNASIFSGLQLTVREGDHTLITGPNGCGKSTLLQIITGDNPNCYANDLSLFGRRRGSGESIWDIKKEMGIVSHDLHRRYYVPGSAFQAVLSGYFDSIGVYKDFSAQQKAEALRWLEATGLADNAYTAFRRLSFAQQRLCLIARALIKMPRLLILDEPTQGLDGPSRSALLDLLETVAERQISTILYASHRTDEYRAFFRQRIDFAHS